ncbi:MAG TPA: SurA N-terminal domain-containing protein [Thermoanaerobaculia bacterium]
MLKVMRESFHQLKWTLFAVIIVFVVGFVFFSGGSTSSRNLSDQTIARVGGDSISAAEYDTRYREMTERYRRVYQGNLSPELIRAMDLPRQVLDSMIDDRLRQEAVKRLRLKVSDEEVSDYIVSMPDLQKDGQFIGKEKYEQLLAANRLSSERFEEEIRDSLLAQKYRALVKASVLVPEADVAKEFAARNERASIEYVKIPSSKLDSGAGPSDKDLQDYYTAHRDRYRLPEQRKVKYLLIDSARIRAKIQVSEADLQAEYAKRKDSFTVPEQVTAAHILFKVDPSQGPEADAKAKAKAEKIAELAKSGKDFAKLANENTEDPSGKGNGGQLPPFSHGQMAPEFERVAFALEPGGPVAGPIKTQFGYHIIKVISKTPARTRSLDEVRPQLQAEISSKRAEAETERRARDLGESLKHRKNDSDDELRKYADNESVFYNTTDWISRGDSVPGVGANPRFSELAFSGKIGQLQKTPVSTARGIAFIKPFEERASGPPPFEEIKARVGLDYQAERRQKEGLDKLTPVAQELSSGTTLAQIASRYETEVKTAPEFSPGGPVPEIGNAPELSDAVFKTAQGQVGLPVAVPGGFVLFRVLTRTTPDPKALEAQRADILDSLKSREADRLIRATLQQMRAEKKVEINEELLKSFLPETGARG